MFTKTHSFYKLKQNDRCIITGNLNAILQLIKMMNIVTIGKYQVEGHSINCSIETVSADKLL